MIRYPEAEPSLKSWLAINKISIFHNLSELRKAYPHADNIKGTDLICINIKGNKYRLIVRYSWGKTVFVKDFLTHTEYSKKYC